MCCRQTAEARLWELPPWIEAEPSGLCLAKRWAQAGRAPVSRPGFWRPWPSVHVDSAGCWGEAVPFGQVCSFPPPSRLTGFHFLSLQSLGSHYHQGRRGACSPASSCPVLRPAQPLLLRTPGSAALFFQTHCPLLAVPSTPSPPLPSQKQKGKNKNCETGERWLTNQHNFQRLRCLFSDVSFHLLSTKVAGPGCRPLIAMLIFNLTFFLIVLNFS